MALLLRQFSQTKLITMKHKFTILIFLFYLFRLTNAQESRLKYLGVEAGMTFMASEMANMDYIRREIPQYYNDYSASSLTCLSNKSFIGIKYELFALNDRLSFASGIRFIQLNSSVGKDKYYRSSTQYFYWRTDNNDLNTNYIRINEISQKSSYLGIPLESRFYIAKKPHFMRLYAKLGAEVSLLLQSKTDVDFYDNAMSKYDDEVGSKIADPKTFNTAIYGGFGVELGGDSKPSVSIEACMPYFNLSSKTSGLVDSFFGGGFQINVRVPLKF